MLSVCSCYRWLPHHEMEPAEEEELIRKAVQSFRKTSKVPCGWFYGRPSANSCALVEKVYKEEGDEFLYWAGESTHCCASLYSD